MKINLKNKVMLAVLAGGMLCMGQALAGAGPYYYGDAFNVNGWKATTENMWSITDARTVGANLTLYGTESYIDERLPSNNIPFAEVKKFFAGYSETGNVTNNTITIKDGTFDGREIYGGWTSEGSATGNKVTISGGTFIGGSIYGGNVDDNGGDASNNTVTISGGTFGDDVSIAGGSTKSNSGNMSGNIVRISGGDFGTVNIVACSGNNTTGEVKNNLVEITGGTFTDGFTLGGRDCLSVTSINNTLNLKIKISGKATQVVFFQKMNFTLPADIANGDTMLETASVTYDNTIIG
ncbi:MAG: hypothetical protein KBS60_00990, partial [Phascolarctobacterium sp.]|nr:hypothetical protein [Candidatus Phascolarctobacterium caballi]